MRSGKDWIFCLEEWIRTWPYEWTKKSAHEWAQKSSGTQAWLPGCSDNFVQCWYQLSPMHIEITGGQKKKNKKKKKRINQWNGNREKEKHRERELSGSSS